uniref:Rho/rac guanine nucleotide exchange factor (GEF) 18b n=1 Tax=Nothobranchius rachovii TaxID=451742 RepID=A0A1A8P4Z3_9TELE
MDETDALRSKRCNEDAISLAPSIAESIIVEDAHYAAVRADLESDAQDLEADSWSLAVDSQYLKKHSKETVKRQDVIYELMQTEMHHVRTLKIMLRVYVRELKENLQMDSSRIDCLFPRLENLLDLHMHFLSRLKERRRENLDSPSDKNYTIPRVADILITQFSGEIGERMKDSYGDFCSHHTEAVSYYKDQLQNNRRFQNLIRKINNLSIVRSSRLLLRGDASDLQQGEILLKGAITEVENLQNLLQSGVREETQSCHTEEGGGSGVLPRRAGTFGGYDSNPSILSKNGSMKKSFSGESRSRDRSQRASSDPQLKDLYSSHTLEQTVDETCSSPVKWNRIWSNSFPEAEFFDRVLMLSQRLYSLEAIVSQQDSQIELQRASLTERVSLPGRHRGNVLLEQEKQRTLALQREELATLHKLQSQHRHEQQRWEKERERHRQQVEATEAKLQQREEECRKLEEQLAKEKEELDRQRETYQQDLERLRESTRAVEKEKERLENLKKIKRKTIEVAPLSGSLNGELLSSSTAVSDLPLSHKPIVRGSLSVAPADYPERPEVTPRREAGSSTLPLKTEVPLHLFSTTNQQHKPVGVQQQIPTKLAAINSGKGKGGKSGKASHRTDSTASVDMKQMLPLKLSSREDNVLKAKRSISPHQQTPSSASPQSHSLHQHSDQLSPPDSLGLDAPHPPNVQKPPMPIHPPPSMPPQCQGSDPIQLQPTSHGPNTQVHGLSHSKPPPYSIATDDLNKEDVIFF